MFVLVLAAEADETRQAITFLIVCLVGVAVLLSLLTAWYWRFTSPSRALAAQTSDGAASDPPPPILVPTGPPSADDAAVVAPADAGTDADAGQPPLVAVAASSRIEVAERPAMALAATRIEVADRASYGASSGTSGPTDDAGVEPNGPSDGANDGLSDEAWAAVMKSAFEKLNH